MRKVCFFRSLSNWVPLRIQEAVLGVRKVFDSFWSRRCEWVRFRAKKLQCFFSHPDWFEIMIAEHQRSIPPSASNPLYYVQVGCDYRKTICDATLMFNQNIFRIYVYAYMQYKNMSTITTFEQQCMHWKSGLSNFFFSLIINAAGVQRSDCWKTACA